MTAPRHVLVTGAAGGIGAGIARDFAAAGERVTAVDMRGEPLAELNATPLVGDLASTRFASELVDLAWDANGAVDVVVAAAGLYPAAPLLELPVELWNRVHAVNLRSVLLILQALGRRCAATGRPACAVALTSGAANRARPGAAHYSTSKAALEMLIRSAALELGPHRVRVNGVSPGFVTVDSPVNPVSAEYTTHLAQNPLGRRGEPADIAHAVRWLCSPEADWISGAILRVDGGASAGANLPLHWGTVTDVQQGRQ